MLIQPHRVKCWNAPGEVKAEARGLTRRGCGGGGGRPAPGRPLCPAVGGGRRLGWVADLPGYGSAGLPGLSGQPLPRVCSYKEQRSGKLRNVIPDNRTHLPAVTYFGFRTVPSDKEKVSITLSTAERQIPGCCFLPRQAGTCPFVHSNGLGPFPSETLEYYGHRLHPQRFLGFLTGSYSERTRKGAWPYAPKQGVV